MPGIAARRTTTGDQRLPLAPVESTTRTALEASRSPIGLRDELTGCEEQLPAAQTVGPRDVGRSTEVRPDIGGASRTWKGRPVSAWLPTTLTSTRKDP
jgi:hypothetical protein